MASYAASASRCARANRDQYLAGHVIGLGFALKDLLAIGCDGIAALEQTAQRLGACDYDAGVLLKEGEEPRLFGHKRLKPAKHYCISISGAESRDCIKLPPSAVGRIAVLQRGEQRGREMVSRAPARR